MRQIIELVIAWITVAMEAQGEPRSGKIGVAYVLMTRKKAGRSMTDVILDPQDFSCWNTNSPTRMNLDQIDEETWAECLRCTLAAFFGLEPDPTGGAHFYMNTEAVMAAVGKLPGWWDSDTIHETEVRIGQHTFRKRKW